MMERTERYIRGLNKLKEIDGEAGEKVIESMIDFAPELVQFIIEYSFGDVYSLTALDNRSKEIVAISSLIAQGAVTQQKVHFNAALNVGCTIAEVKEVILQLSGYVGFPRCINAMNAFMEVVKERKTAGKSDPWGAEAHATSSDNRYKKGADTLGILDKLQTERLEKNYNEFAPELVKFILEYAYGDIYSRDNLSKRMRQMATIAALTTLGDTVSQLNFHINAALNIGVTTEELKEIMLLMSVYRGFPAAINGMNALQNIVGKR